MMHEEPERNSTMAPLVHKHLPGLRRPKKALNMLMRPRTAASFATIENHVHAPHTPDHLQCRSEIIAVKSLILLAVGICSQQYVLRAIAAEDIEGEIMG